MILTKTQIITSYIEGEFSKCKPSLKKKMLQAWRKLPELTFIARLKKDYNWRLDPIRKNLYIIT